MSFEEFADFEEQNFFKPDGDFLYKADGVDHPILLEIGEPVAEQEYPSGVERLVAFKAGMLFFAMSYGHMPTLVTWLMGSFPGAPPEALMALQNTVNVLTREIVDSKQEYGTLVHPGGNYGLSQLVELSDTLFESEANFNAHIGRMEKGDMTLKVRGDKDAFDLIPERGPLLVINQPSASTWRMGTPSPN